MENKADNQILPTNNNGNNGHPHQRHILYGKKEVFNKLERIPTETKPPHKRDLRNQSGYVIGDTKDINTFGGRIHDHHKVITDTLENLKVAFLSGNEENTQQAVQHALDAGVEYEAIRKIRFEVKTYVTEILQNKKVTIPGLPPPHHIYDPYSEVLGFVQNNPSSPVCEFLATDQARLLNSKKLISFLTALSKLQQKVADRTTTIAEIEQYTSEKIRKKFGQDGYRLNTVKKICQSIIQRNGPVKIGIVRKQ